MKLHHARIAGETPRRGLQAPDGGFTAVMTALLIVPMMIFAGLAVDVGSWYTRALEIQRAADAAALAGVVWLPADVPRAEREALDAAEQNGFDHEDENITVDVRPVAGRPQELDVVITDHSVPTYMGAVVTKSISITRSARSRYVLPIPLGSPFNYFGNQNVTPSANDPKLFGAINSPYARHQSGDPFATRCAGEPASVRSCDAAGANEHFRTEGYRYIVDVPSTAVGRSLTVEVLDGLFAPRSRTTVETGDGYDWCFASGRDSCGASNANRPAVSYELFEADFSPLDVTDNVTTKGRCSQGPGQLVYGNNHSTTTDLNAWRTICRINVTTAGQWIIQVRTSGIEGQTDQSASTNQYSLKATLSGSGAQPRMYAHGEMSILTNYKVEGSATVANNYLAEVAQTNAGKALEVSLFDAGDGGNGQFDLSLVAPNGTVPNCRYNAPGSTELGTLRTCTIRTRNDGTDSVNNLYNDQWLRIQIPIPANYTCNEAGTTPANPGPGTASACWWRLSYRFGGTNPTPTDRTTWQANILGDPVQLIR